MEKKKRKYVASIDIGTAYSGCAFCDRKEYVKNPLNIDIVPAKGGGESDYEKTKQPSTILFNKERRFEAFGFIAESKYAKELQKQAKFNDSDWFYFKNFKMNLYENKDVSRDINIRDKSGKEMKAMNVFEAGIRYLKNEVVTMINNKKGDTPEKEITFVLTIPAIWNEPAKQFMKEAAVKAGIPKEQLVLALEPEAAAVYCKTLWEKGYFGQHDAVIKRCMEPGGRYFVLDLGGGTIDTTVHELKENGDLIEIYKASGGPWGGCTVNTNFINYIDKLYGEAALTQMRQMRPLDCYELENSFETKKRVLTEDDDVDVRLKVPNHLKIFSDNEVEQHTIEHLYVTKKDFMNFFDSCVTEINKHIHKVLKKVGNIELMLLVGGFSQSRYVEQKVKSANKRMKIIVPGESSVAILKGAVLFGYRPSCITARICRYTYGIGIMRPFDPKIHLKEKMKIVDGEEKCADIFKVLVNKNTVVNIDEEMKANTNTTHRDSDRRYAILCTPVYASVHRDPMYTTDEGCTYLGKIIIEPPRDGWGEESRFTHCCYFGRTQITLKVYDEINKRDYDSKFDLLEYVKEKKKK